MAFMNRGDDSDAGAGDDSASARLDALFEQARAHAPASDQLAHMLRAVPPAAAQRHGQLWRIAGGLAAGAAVLAGVALVLAPPGQPRVFALSQVVSAMQEVPIIQMTYSNGMTTWEKRGWYIAGKRDNGRYVWLWDLRNLVHTTYDAERGCIMLCNMQTPEFLKEGSPISTLDSIIAGLDARGERLEDVWERADIDAAGRTLIELKDKKCAKGYPGTKIILIDRESRKVVSYTNWGPHTNWADVRVDLTYPTIAPSSIYKLGVPAVAKVIDGRASPELLVLRDEVLAARQRGFGPYHMVWISTGEAKTIARVLSDGTRHRVDLIPLAEPGNHTQDELAALVRTCICTDPSDNRYTYAVFDGKKETQIRRHADGSPSERSISRIPGYFSRFMHLLEYHGWQRSDGFFMLGPDRADELVGPDEHGWLGYRSESQAHDFNRPELWEWWFDPAHGYRLAARRHYDFPHAEWQMKSNWQDEYVKYVGTSMIRPLPDAPAKGGEFDVLEWGSLREGEWYPALIRQRNVVQTPDGRWEERDHSDLYDQGYVCQGEIVRTAERTVRPHDDPVSYTRVLAEPLAQVEDDWFHVPGEWLAVPAKQWP